MQDLTPFKADVVDMFYGNYSRQQNAVFDLIYAEGRKRDRMLTEVAYAYATAYHESQRFLKLEETGRGAGYQYGRACPLWHGDERIFYGRGLVHLTWLGNYAQFTALHGVDYVSKPDLVAQPAVAASIMYEGMILGLFRGKSFADYFPKDGSAPDYIGARDIINGGRDKADLIAGYAERFERGLSLVWDSASPERPVPHCAAPDCPMRFI